MKRVSFLFFDVCLFPCLMTIVTIMQRTFACTTLTFCPGNQLQNLCIQGQESHPSCTLWGESTHWEVFPNFSSTMLVKPQQFNHRYPGVVCGGSITLSSIGGYPNGLNPFTYFCHHLSIFHLHCLALADSVFKGFFGWGYEDHELLWRVEESDGEPDRQHWGSGRCACSKSSFSCQFETNYIISFIWFEGYDEIQHTVIGTNLKVEQHKHNRAR